MGREPMQPDRPTVCPLCGSALVFEREVNGYGRTIERCERFQLHKTIPGVVVGCSHWEVFPKLKQPAHTAPPVMIQRGPAAIAPARQIMRKTGMRMTKVLAVLPADESQARTTDEVAVLIKLDPQATMRVLKQLVAESRVNSRFRVTPGQMGRRPVEYWRVA